MKIETYEVEEVNNELAAMAADSEALEIIDKLGLAGQKALANGETATRHPYRRMTKEEHFVYSMLCPVSSPLKDFKSETIPLRVLQVAAHAIDCGMFKSLVIWSPEYASIKDPVLVGIATPPGQTWGDAFYILARWGKELDPMETMLPMARKIWSRKMRAKYAQIKAEIAADERMIDATESSDTVPTKYEPPSFYGIS